MPKGFLAEEIWEVEEIMVEVVAEEIWLGFSPEGLLELANFKSDLLALRCDWGPARGRGHWVQAM